MDKDNLLYNSYKKVFNHSDFDKKDFFNPNMQCCAIAGIGELLKPQYLALINSVKLLDEQSCYLAVVEYGCDEIYKISNRKIYQSTTEIKEGDVDFNLFCSSFLSFKEYKNMRMILRHAFFSCKGTWGVLVTEEDTSFVVGVPEFIAAFKEQYKAYARSHKIALGYWKYAVDNYGFNADIYEWYKTLV